MLKENNLGRLAVIASTAINKRYDNNEDNDSTIITFTGATVGCVRDKNGIIKNRKCAKIVDRDDVTDSLVRIEREGKYKY